MTEPIHLDIIRLEAAAVQVRMVSVYGRKDHNRLAELQRRAKRPIIEMIGMLRAEQGRKAFSCYSRQYRQEGDNDDCEDFATFEEAQAWARKEREGRAGVRVWINNVEM